MKWDMFIYGKQKNFYLNIIEFQIKNKFMINIQNKLIIKREILKFRIQMNLLKLNKNIKSIILKINNFKMNKKKIY